MMKGSNKEKPLGIDPQLVHRILLTDPSQFSSLSTCTSGNHFANLGDTLTFDDFVKELSPSSDQSVESTMKGAFREAITESVSEGDMSPVSNLLLELHQALRALVPNRPDLHHSILSDEDVKNAKTIKELLPYVVKAGDALASSLESEFQSEMTQEWLQKARGAEDSEQSTEFVVNSILYLLFKTELCQREKQDFFLATFWAPRIRNKGAEFERQAFEARYGKFHDKNTAPLTRKWISELVMEGNRSDLMGSYSAREALVKQGWVNSILFRPPEKPSLSMPEILLLDFEQLNSIRLVTRSAAAGSALALHACNAAGVGVSVLKEPINPTSPIELRRQGVVEAMASQHSFKTREEYEEHVGKAVVRLAKEWNPALDEEAESQLKSRTTSVLRSEDAVIRLLDSRMKEVFSALMTWSPSSANVEMRSGHNDSPRASDAAGKAFLATAKSALCQRGLSFYSSDLANVSYLAKKVADLAWKVYGDALLDEMIIDACNAAKIDPE